MPFLTFLYDTISFYFLQQPRYNGTCQSDTNSDAIHQADRGRIARLHARRKDLRKDFLQKLSTRVIIENQVIALEELNKLNRMWCATL
jgi:hypothetical protein